MPLRPLLTATVLAIIGLVGGCGDEDDPSLELDATSSTSPALRDGLWRMTYSSSTSARSVAFVCVDPAIDVLDATVNRHAGSLCETEVERGGDAIRFNAVCPTEGGGSRTVAARRGPEARAQRQSVIPGNWHL